MQRIVDNIVDTVVWCLVFCGAAIMEDALRGVPTMARAEIGESDGTELP